MSDVAPRPINVLSMCSGVGMLDLAIGLAFHARTVCYVEREAFAAAQLVNLMEAQCLDEAPVHADLASFDGRAWRGVVDCIVAGLPCQPYSVAGKRQGNSDHRSHGDGDGPIPQFLRIVDEVRPALVYLENVPAWVAAREQWFRPVGERLSAMGYRLESPIFLAAADVGASHERERVFILAFNPIRGRRILRESSRRYGQPDWSNEAAADTARHERDGLEQHLTGASGTASDDCGGGENMGHTRLQHRDLQQRDIRSEHPGADIAMDDAGCAERRPNFIAGSGGGEGRDGERQATSRAGESMQVVGNTKNTDGRSELEARGTQGGRCRPSENGGHMANPGSQRLERREQQSAHEPDGRTDGRTEQESCRSITQLRDDELFAPGPADPRWSAILAASPWLAPATQPGVCGLVDGTEMVVDESRTNQLRSIGNGAVPLCAAFAFATLARRVIA